jgi:hypothetical protein
VVEGPVIVESYGTSIPLPPGQRAHVDEWLNLVIEITPVHTLAALQPTGATRKKREMVKGNA